MLKLKVSDTAQSISYTNEAGIMTGPKSFAVEDNTYYILDGCKKIVYVCNSTGITNILKVPSLSYPTDIRVTKEYIYILDNEGKDESWIIKLDKKGVIVSKDNITTALNDKASFMDIVNNKLVINGMNNTKLLLEDNKVYQNVSNILSNSKKTQNNKGQVSIGNGNTIDVDVVEKLGSINVKHKDNNGNIYVNVEEVADTSKILVEQTIREYDKNGNNIGTASIPLENYYAYPSRFVDITDSGKVYSLILNKDYVEIVQLNLNNNFKSQLGNLKESYLKSAETTSIKPDDASKTAILSASVMPGVSRSSAASKAQGLNGYGWTFHTTNRKSISDVTTPEHLTSTVDGAYVNGIPYCWGGFDSDWTSSSGSWTNYTNAMLKGMNAGNVNCTGYWKGSTAGLDCSGYASVVLGLQSKWGTGNFISDTSYFRTISTSALQSMDILVSTGHIVFYTGNLSNGITTYECTVSGVRDECKSWSRTWSELSGYTPRSCF